MKVINRLRKSEDFKKTIHKSLYAQTDSYAIHVKENDLDHMRIGISTSKKLGNAVVRARVRRQIRSFFSVYNIYKKNYDIVIVVKGGYLNHTYLENKDALKENLDFLINKGDSRKHNEEKN
jgi:ribonuclease P protein component